MFHKTHIYKFHRWFHIIQTLCRLSRHFSARTRHFSGHPDTFQITRIIKTLFISNISNTIQIVQTLCRSSRNFVDHTDTFQIIRTPFRSSGHLSDHLDIFWINRRLFRSPGSSRHFSYHQDNLQIIWRTLCRPLATKTFRSHCWQADDVFVTLTPR